MVLPAVLFLFSVGAMEKYTVFVENTASIISIRVIRRYLRIGKGENLWELRYKSIGRSTHTHIHTRARAHTHTHAHTRTRTHARMHARTHARTHAHTHTHTHTHVSTVNRKNWRVQL